MNETLIPVALLMAQISESEAKSFTVSNGVTGRTSRTMKPNYGHIHAHPLPLRTFPLPLFVPHNPFSILQAVWCSIKLWWSRSSSHPPTLYQARLSIDSCSVQVTDPATMRGLWENGFFGKGSLSRSEPSWLERERMRRGLSTLQTSEETTRKRREERKEFKKERARKERAEIERLLEIESKADYMKGAAQSQLAKDHVHPEGASANGMSLDQDNLKKSDTRSEQSSAKGILSIQTVTHSAIPLEPPPEDSACKSPDEEQPRHTSAVAQNEKPRYKKMRLLKSDTSSKSPPAMDSPAEELIHDQEHLQLTPEEAFFLLYGLGVLEIWDAEGTGPLSSHTLLRLFRQGSYFPPRSIADLRMDDPFLVSYVVYHRFRSLGWVVRPGVKFGVDYLLYNRGPVFAHAEFAAVIIPSYNHQYYALPSTSEYDSRRREPKSWEWLHCVNRVQSQVRKSLLLVYVEVPPPDEVSVDRPETANEPVAISIGGLLRRYQVREIIVRRWIPNRTRD